MTKWARTRIDLSKFLEGWILVPPGETAHYVTRTRGAMKSDCGLRFAPRLRDRGGFVAFEPGDFPRCRKCAAK